MGWCGFNGTPVSYHAFSLVAFTPAADEVLEYMSTLEHVPNAGRT